VGAPKLSWKSVLTPVLEGQERLMGAMVGVAVGGGVGVGVGMAVAIAPRTCALFVIRSAHYS